MADEKDKKAAPKKVVAAPAPRPKSAPPKPVGSLSPRPAPPRPVAPTPIRPAGTGPTSAPVFAKPASPVAAAPTAQARDEGTKQLPHVVREVAAKDRERAMKSALDERAVRVGVVKVPEFDTPKAAPGAPGPKTETLQLTPKTPEAKAEEEAGKDGKKGKKGKKGKEEPEKEEEEEKPEETFPMTEHDKQVEMYPINAPYAYVQITYNDVEKETRYRVIEPELTKQEKKILKFIENTMVDVLDAPPEEIEKKSLQDFLKEKFEEIVFDYAIDLGEEEAQMEETKGKLLYYIYRDFIGEGRIDCMMRDPLIEDISCDGPHQPVFIYHRKVESVKSTVKFRDDDELDSFVIRMAQRAGKHVSIAEPILDATMPDGSRLQATLAHEVSAYGSTFTIRKFRSEPFTPPDLVRFGTMSAEILAYWWIAIQHGSSAIYAGGTASGKTTGLNAILLFIPPQMKIVSIEDTRELALPHPNWIAGITRGGFGPRDEFGRQAGEIDMFQLLKNALRQRPEYIIVGEVRGKEAYNLFQAMATGHAAYGTMHADSVDSVIHRLESDPINIPRALLGALDVISIQIQTRVGGKRVRRTKQLSEIVGLDPHTQEILTNEVFRWVPKDDSFKYSGVSYVLERIQVEKGLTPQDMKNELDNRVEIIKYMIKHDVRKYRDVGRIVSTYYKDPQQLMEIIRKDMPWQ